MEKTIVLLDMNAFFASVEQVCNPALKGKPIGVCGERVRRSVEGADGKVHTVGVPIRSIITTCSYEARARGVKTAMSIYEALNACPELILVPGNMDKYIDTSRRIHAALLEFTDQVEVYSIDECFMDITHLVKGPEDAKNVCRDIKRRIKEETGLLCSIGVGPNKMLAKLGSKMQKPDGLVELHAEDVPEKVWPLPLEKLQGVGIGPRLCERLNRLGIRSAGDLARTDARQMVVHFGIYGHTLRDIGLGLGSDHVRGYYEYDQAKSVGHSYTLPRDTSDLKVIKAYLRTLSERVGVRMREAGLVGRTVSCYLRFGDFSGIGRQHALKACISSGVDIYTAACGILREFLPLNQPVRLVGVTMSEVVLDGGQQLLFEDMRKRETFEHAVDEINKKYGEFTVKPMAVMVSDNFGDDKKVGAFGKYFMGGPPKDYLGGLIKPKIK